jgi:small-conductance mechanosensitive channel
MWTFKRRMDHLNLILGIIFVILFLFSVHFSFADKIIDSWIRTENKIHFTILIITFGALILLILFWNIFRFL